jgi:hypothetical protein
MRGRKGKLLIRKKSLYSKSIYLLLIEVINFGKKLYPIRKR